MYNEGYWDKKNARLGHQAAKRAKLDGLAQRLAKTEEALKGPGERNPSVTRQIVSLMWLRRS